MALASSLFEASKSPRSYATRGYEERPGPWRVSCHVLCPREDLARRCNAEVVPQGGAQGTCRLAGALGLISTKTFTGCNSSHSVAFFSGCVLLAMCPMQAQAGIPKYYTPPVRSAFTLCV